MFVQNIQIYSNIYLFAKDCFGLFWLFSYFLLFWAHIKEFWTNNNQVKPFLGNNENSNIFAIIDIGQMNIQIHLSDCFGLFWPFSYFLLFWANIKEFWTNDNQDKPFLGNNENSNIIAIIDIGQMNIQIHLSV